MEQARTAGAVIVKPAQATFWGGYSGYFQDPDQHLWEVVWNPALKCPNKAGTVWQAQRVEVQGEQFGRDV